MPLAVAETRPLVTVTTFDMIHSIGCCVAPVQGPLGAAAWTGANQAMYVPIYLSEPGIIAKLFIANGAVAGNVDISLHNGDTLAKIVSAGSTAMSGASVLQVFDTTDVWVPAGRYYLGAVCSTVATATFMRMAPGLQMSRMFGVLQQATALPLPDPMVPATVTTSFIPLLGLTYRVTI